MVGDDGFDVWLSGFAPQSQANASESLQRVFGVDASFARALLASLPRSVKRNLSRGEGERYVAMLREIGAVAELRAAQTATPAPAAAEIAPPPAPAAVPVPPAMEMIDLGVDDPGAASALDIAVVPRAREKRATLAPAAGAPIPTPLPPAATASTSPAQPPPSIEPSPAAVRRSAGIVGAALGAIVMLRVVWVGGFVPVAPDLGTSGFGPRPDDTAGGRERITSQDLGMTIEAREFLDSTSTRVWAERISEDSLRDVIQSLYEAGARRVMFAGISTLDDGTMVSSWLVAELPTVKPMRTQIFVILSDVFGAPQTDFGQEYAGIALD